ncbi:MAG: hypothetical protein P4N41_25775 [Negativicutes bacterium]|nr:hypothetical protein [Negativicutes bacterium]
MKKVCPLCNGFETVTTCCHCCGAKMTDAGKLSDYRGPYSPYMDVAALHDFVPATHCVHLLTCPGCGHDARAAWELVGV